tara:strand:+ start:137 stop:424 length:288 start_codon:yes stop_codon:yes gene_type:complete
MQVIEKDARKIDELDRQLDDMKYEGEILTSQFIIDEARYTLGKFFSNDWYHSQALAGDENALEFMGWDVREAPKQVRQLKRFLIKHTGSDHYTES